MIYVEISEIVNEAYADQCELTLKRIMNIN